jgi:hypothetical protein
MVSELETCMGIHLNGWFPIDTAPKRNDANGNPIQILVTHFPSHSKKRPPVNLVRWGICAGYQGKRWVRDSESPLRYEPTHWTPVPELPVLYKGD